MVTKILQFFTVKPAKFVYKKFKPPFKNQVKSVIQFGIAGYAINWVWQKAYSDAIAYQKIQNYIEEAAKKGNRQGFELSAKEFGKNQQQTDWHLQPLKHILVILNPSSSGGDSGKYFESMIQPILDVSGFHVHIHKTKGVKEARDVCEGMIPGKFSAVIVVGGDGTLSEVISGFMRREDRQQILSQVPIGLIPTGIQNQTYKNLIKNQDPWRSHDLSISGTADQRADFIIRETERLLTSLNNDVTTSVNSSANYQNLKKFCSRENLLEIRMKRKSETEEEALNRKPTYSLSGLEWGIEKEVVDQRERFWWCMPFKKFMARYFQAEENKEQRFDCDFQWQEEFGSDSKENILAAENASTSKASKQGFFRKSLKSASTPLNSQTEIFPTHETWAIIAQNIEINTRDDYESMGGGKLKLQMIPRNVLGSSFQYGMSSDMLREFRGNRPYFHRVRLHNFETKEEGRATNIFIDGTNFELDDVDWIDIRLKKDMFFMIQ